MRPPDENTEERFFARRAREGCQGFPTPGKKTSNFLFIRPEDERSRAMPSAYTQNFYHAVFSTKHRDPLNTPELEQRLYPFLGGIVRDLRCTLIAVNGMPDHVHLLIRYRADLSHSEMLQHIKGRSSKWINESMTQSIHFAWQEGYGGFTVSKSAVPDVEVYIGKQKMHHQKMDYKTEFLQLLRLHGIEFDESQIFQ
jgi:REP element-mobilizing transposase RayT